MWPVLPCQELCYSTQFIRLLKAVVLVAEQGGHLAQWSIQNAVNLIDDKIGNILVKCVGDASGDAGDGIAISPY